ncbi:MAG: DUF1587 domain-containing protein, partial [Bryobacteraceae bacterium]
MKRLIYLSVLLGSGFAGTFERASAEDGPGQYRTLLATYCVTCHNARLKTGGLVLEGLDIQSPGNHAYIWERALRKLRAHQMPPPGLPQPAQKDADSFIAWMEGALDAHAKGPTAGYVPIERLNRTEYAASVRMLLAVQVNAKEVLPQDIRVEGFDNIADALSVSPAFLDQYITAARQVARVALGNPNPRVSGVKYTVAASQNPRNPLPPGTRGGIAFEHNFPVDGDYQINIKDLAVGPYSNALETQSTLVIMIDGRMVFRNPIGGRTDLALVDRQAGTGRSRIMERFSKIPVHVEAGSHEVAVAFIDRSHVASDENFQILEPYNGLTGGAAALNSRAELRDAVEIVGPFQPTGISETASRAIIFICNPKTGDESACARRITENLARRAFRRPLTAADMNRL